jgi:hypothetical protein
VAKQLVQGGAVRPCDVASWAKPLQWATGVVWLSKTALVVRDASNIEQGVGTGARACGGSNQFIVINS